MDHPFNVSKRFWEKTSDLDYDPDSWRSRRFRNQTEADAFNRNTTEGLFRAMLHDLIDIGDKEMIRRTHDILKKISAST